MMKHGKTLIRNYMTMSFEFAGIRIQEGYFTPVDWDLSVNLIVNKKKGKSKEDIEYNAGILYQKLLFWLETNLQSIVVFDATEEDDLYISNLSSNITMYCPGNPSDDMLIKLIHSKLTALAGTELVVGEIKLKGSDTSLQYTFDAAEGEYELPECTAEYFIHGKCRDDEPWWTRDDGFCFEFVRPTDIAEDDNSVFEGIVDPMTEFERIISEMSDTHIGMVREPARIVQVEKWKPRKVE